MTDSDTNPFEQMAQGLEPVQDPAYLQYWDVRAEASEDDARVAQIVRGLTFVALRGEAGKAEYTDREPALQARYWYRSLGPLNPLVDAEPDLITAAKMMYGKKTEKPEENASVQLDSAYLLADLARHSSRPETRRSALGLGLNAIERIKQDEHFGDRGGLYRLQTSILEGDLRHDAIRIRHTGELSPAAVSGEAYRAFEKDFAKEELRAITEFGRLISEGITDENFGALFEWYFIIARRHQSWADETLDSVAVRGATSRENAEWTGEYVVNQTRVTGNHDIVVTTMKRDGNTDTERYQLKAVGTGNRQYHPRVKVLDFEKVMEQKFGNIDRATDVLVRNLRKIRDDYKQTMG